MWPAKPRTVRPSEVVAQLWPLADVKVRGGHPTEVEVTIDRSGPDRDLRIHFDGLPPGVTCPDVTVPPGSGQAQVKAHFRAVPHVEDAKAKLTVSLWRGGQKVSAQTVLLEARKFRAAHLDDVPEGGIRLAQGRSTTLIVRVKPNGNTDRWTLHPVEEHL